MVSDVSDPAQARALEQALLEFGGVYGLVEGRLTGLAARPPAGVALAGGVLLIAAPAAALPALREIHQLCAAALRIAAPQDRRGYHDLTALAGEIALTAQPLLGDLLARPCSARSTRGTRSTTSWPRTALAYLDHGQRLRPTAEALHLHPNTVRYRLDRLAELTPLALAENAGARVLDAVRSWWALHHWLDTRADSGRGPCSPGLECHEGAPHGGLIPRTANASSRCASPAGSRWCSVASTIPVTSAIRSSAVTSGPPRPPPPPGAAAGRPPRSASPNTRGPGDCSSRTSAVARPRAVAA